MPTRGALSMVDTAGHHYFSIFEARLPISEYFDGGTELTKSDAPLFTIPTM